MTRAPDFVEPFRGWRVWRVVETPRGLRLWSVLYEDEWEPRDPFRGGCHAGAAHAVPARDCACGIYAARSAVGAGRYLLGRNDTIVVTRAIGIVALWGTVLAGVDGFRASLAYPARLWLPREFARAVDVYGVTVEVAPARRAADVVAKLANAA